MDGTDEQVALQFGQAYGFFGLPATCLRLEGVHDTPTYETLTFAIGVYRGFSRVRAEHQFEGVPIGGTYRYLFYVPDISGLEWEEVQPVSGEQGDEPIDDEPSPKPPKVQVRHATRFSIFGGGNSRGFCSTNVWERPPPLPRRTRQPDSAWALWPEEGFAIHVWHSGCGRYVLHRLSEDGQAQYVWLWLQGKLEHQRARGRKPPHLPTPEDLGFY